LFNRATKLLFFSGALITGFLIPWVTEIIEFTLGEAYLGGIMAMSIMFLYPVNQAQGQVSGATFLALELTRPYVVIGILGMVTSIAVAYFVLAPVDARIPGLALGSTGIALKMVGLQFATVNASIWWISRRLDGQFNWVYQFTGMGTLLLFGYLAYIGVNEIIGESVQVVIRALIAGLIYIAATAAVLYKTPGMFGIDRGQLKDYAKMLSGIMARQT
jgi:O-antigen/teichoic acid export membrane protein